MIDIPQKFDKFQYAHRYIGFIVAVFKGYSKDQGGRNAALITYYMFMSLFPLLLWLSIIANWLNQYYPGVSSSLIHGATNYFPVFGQQLFKISHAAHRSLLGMIIPGLVAIYGARGTAITFQSIVNDIWGISKADRKGFPSSWLRGVAIVLIGGSGFIITAIFTSWAFGHGHGLLLRVVAAIVSITLLSGVFLAVLKLSLSTKTKLKELLSGAVLMSIALSTLQMIGGFVVTHDLKHYTDAYTALFATTLGLLAWIYAEAQIILYSIEVTAVVNKRSWPIKLFTQ